MQSILIRDAASGASAKIAVDYGFNCYSFVVPQSGEQVETLYCDPAFLEKGERPSHSGIPLMFPFAGRLQGTSYVFHGQTYHLSSVPDDGQGNAIHGFVINRPWRVLEKEDHYLLGEFHASRDDHNISQQWPADFRIRARYEVQGATLKSEFTIDNPDSRPLPFGFGTHPYFRVPLGAAGKAESCVVKAPAFEYWELHKMIPTGKRLPAAGAFAISDGLPFDKTKFDDVFTTIEFHHHRAEATIHDPGAKRTLAIGFDSSMQHLVIYNPPHRQAICLEPYTAVPDAFALQGQGLTTGQRVLLPGEQWSTRVDMELRADG